jgi:hypothetical protein
MIIKQLLSKIQSSVVPLEEILAYVYKHIHRSTLLPTINIMERKHTAYMKKAFLNLALGGWIRRVRASLLSCPPHARCHLSRYVRVPVGMDNIK